MAVVANKRSVMTLYSDGKSPYSHRVRLVLAEKSITVEIIDTDPVNLSEDIMDLNPYGTLPTLVDRDLTLFESRIIMEYLDERFPHPPLLPVDPVARASSRLFMHRVDRDWYTLMDEVLAGGKGAAKARKELRESLIVSASIFAAKPFFMSGDFTLVDCSIAPMLWRLPMMGIELPASAKAVNEYAERMFERDSFKECLTESEREMRE
ncbi:glutathione S-transferase N-terminal domain-containing protein [Solemya velesiana gill symbiont]|uniref:Stringent starvation protein A n=1 Tax=Solemya velesiana gill symbiont TaxID=1918948 RepID=A0A1T2KXH7_9GAMM|nr:glutathione S-transferase N-terminal domain-containing protein [Solemya velesiana gill symbiont]OOZ37426.1 stringent starvation protein A [Solemya velesiana gill symbiont]